MARKGEIEIPIAVDTSGVQKSISNGLVDPVEDAEKALDKLGRTDAGSDIDKAMDKAQDATKDLSGELDDARKDLQKLGYAARDAGDDARRGTDRAKAGVEDLRTEANQTGREMAASFREPADALDAVQELAANALGGFGPLGAAAGLTAAVGIGLVGTELGKQQEQAQRLGEYLAGAYQSAAEEGRKYIDAATIIGEANDILFNPDRVGEFNQAQRDAVSIGIDTNTLIRARAGDQDALNTVIAATAAAQDDLAASTEAAGSNAIRLSLDERNELARIKGDYERIGALHDENAQRAVAAQEIRDGLHEEERAQIARTADAAQARYERPIIQKVIMEVDSSRYDAWRPNPKTGVIMATVARSANQER